MKPLKVKVTDVDPTKSEDDSLVDGTVYIYDNGKHVDAYLYKNGKLELLKRGLTKIEIAMFTSVCI